MNQIKRQVSLIDNGKNLSEKEIFESLVKERFDETLELTDETNLMIQYIISKVIVLGKN